MEIININNKSEEAPPMPIFYENNLDNYNCTEYSSLIEIISINEKDNIIKFKCNNKDNIHKKISIKEYLNKMKKIK